VVEAGKKTPWVYRQTKEVLPTPDWDVRVDKRGEGRVRLTRISHDHHFGIHAGVTAAGSREWRFQVPFAWFRVWGMRVGYGHGEFEDGLGIGRGRS